MGTCETDVLSKGLGRVLGQASEFIHNRAAQQLPELVRDLMDDALTLWAGNGWRTFNHLESNCSAQLYRWLRAAKRADKRFFPLGVNLENLEVTPGMLAGTESIVGASRADLRIHAGETTVLIEAKRLTDTAKHCRAYVDDGMARFVSSAYGAADGLGHDGGLRAGTDARWNRTSSQRIREGAFADGRRSRTCLGVEQRPQ